MANPNRPDAPVSDELAVDELDDQLDYEGIVARTEADRRAGRVLSREEMRARTDRKLAELRASQRTA